MYVRNWDEFYAAAKQLYKDAPTKARFLTKYRHNAGKLVLKVTDDRKCLKYKTDQASDLRKLERANALMLTMMCRGVEAAEEIEEEESRQANWQQQQHQHQPTGKGKKRRGKRNR